MPYRFAILFTLGTNRICVPRFPSFFFFFTVHSFLVSVVPLLYSFTLLFFAIQFRGQSRCFTLFLSVLFSIQFRGQSRSFTLFLSILCSIQLRGQSRSFTLFLYVIIFCFILYVRTWFIKHFLLRVLVSVVPLLYSSFNFLLSYYFIQEPDFSLSMFFFLSFSPLSITT